MELEDDIVAHELARLAEEEEKDDDGGGDNDGLAGGSEYPGSSSI